MAYMQQAYQMDDTTAYMMTLATQQAHAQYAAAAASMYQQQPGVVDPMAAYMMAPQVMFEPPQASGQTRCSKHGKMRSRACMEDDGRGGLCCSPEYECKTKSDPNHPPAGGTIVCSAHGKQRSMNCLVDDGAGGYRCTGDNVCKGASSEMGGMFGKMSSGTMLCSVHGKKRSINCLMDDGMGGYRCVGDNQCKGAAPVAQMTEMAAAIQAYQAQNQTTGYTLM